MTELTFEQADWMMDAAGTWLRIKADVPRKAQMFLETMNPGKKYVAEIKEFRKKRSLDANSYAWVLMNKLADKLNMGVRDIYRHYIPDIPNNSETICVQDSAVDKLRTGWEHNGLGWCSDVTASKLPGCTNVVLYYGSSTFDQHQMGIMLDLIIADCKQVGIETLTPAELARMNLEWGERAAQTDKGN